MKKYLYPTLFGLVSEFPCLVWPGGPWCPVDGRKLPVMPAPDPLGESVDVRLLLASNFSHVLIGTHLLEI